MGRDTEFNFGHAAEEILDPKTGDVKLCMGRVKCVHCGTIYGVCCELEAELTQTENTTMLPRAPQQQGGSQRTPRSGYTYVTEADLSQDKVVARILATKLNDAPLKDGQRRFSDLALQIAFKGQTRLFGVKFFDGSGATTPNYQFLLDGFGEDNDQWVGREFYLYAEKEEFTGRIFPRVEPIPVEKPKGKK